MDKQKLIMEMGKVIMLRKTIQDFEDKMLKDGKPGDHSIIIRGLIESLVGYQAYLERDFRGMLRDAE